MPLEVFLVDNASTDATPELVRSQAAGHENVHAILNRENYGLAYANNQPLGRLRGEYVLILNPDTALRDGALAGLVRTRGPPGCRRGGRRTSTRRDAALSYHKLDGGSRDLWRLVPYALVPGPRPECRYQGD